MSDPVTRLNAALKGRYQIERELGEGGMATVYLAKDLKHNRNVALKVLKPELAAVVGAERFLAEIETTANLQHPHILPLFDSGEADGFLFYVMPYVEGESLRQRLDREHQLPVEEAVRIATNVAEALDYAHRHGVIHRDIKPGNVLIHDGQPVISDFGIALAVGVAGGGRLTETGLSLGTPHYMSPEQATGDQNIGPPTDLYALGCVLYEMLVGEPPYTGSTAQAVLGKIIAGKLASATEQRASVPANVDAAIRRALEKLPADRFTSAHDLASALADPAFRHGKEVAEEVSPAVSGPWNRLAVGFATTTVLLTLAAAWGWLNPPPPTQPAHATRSIIDLGDISLQGFDKIIVSPDGSRFAVTGAVDGQRALYWRAAADENFRVIPGTEGPRAPAAFSPDGEWIVYATLEGALLKVSLSGGAPTPVVVSGAVDPFSPHWGDDGTIVFSGPTGVYRVPDTSGEPVLLLEPGQAFRRPSLLPGGRAVIGALLGGGIMLLDLETDSVRELVPGGFSPQYVETGHILYADDSGGLWALPFDAGRGEVLGGAVPIFDGLSVLLGRFAHFSVSRNGTLVYGAGAVTAAFGGAGTEMRLLVVDLEGDGQPLVLAPRIMTEVNWSPDGRSVAYSSVTEGDADPDIFTYDVQLGTTPRQLTFEGRNRFPVFSPDGTRVAFASLREGTDAFDLFVKTLADDVPARSIVTLPGDQTPTQWPSDTLIVFESGSPSDLWMLNLSDPDSARAEVYLPLEAELRDIVISRDGTLAAYTSDETGGNEVYIRSFPEPGERTPVSGGGGQFPFWSPDGNTVFYWTLSGTGGSVDVFMAARLQRNPTPVVLSRDTLFTGNYFRPGSDLHPDGDRLVVAQTVGAATNLEGVASEPERFLVVVNWFEELRERVEN